jgi:hypothetical protein
MGAGRYLAIWPSTNVRYASAPAKCITSRVHLIAHMITTNQTLLSCSDDATETRTVR